MRAAACCVALLMASAVVIADDHSVIFDEDIDFSTFRTFTMREVRMNSDRPELNFPAVAETIGESIRTALTKVGLKEVDSRADLFVECQVTGVDFAIGQFGRPNAIPPGRGGRRGGRPAPVADFTEVTMVLDLIRSDTGALVLRGVYHDEEKNSQKLVEALPKDAATLLSKYPKGEQ